jgi:hypothetical protein
MTDTCEYQFNGLYNTICLGDPNTHMYTIPICDTDGIQIGTNGCKFTKNEIENFVNSPHFKPVENWLNGLSLNSSDELLSSILCIKFRDIFRFGLNGSFTTLSVCFDSQKAKQLGVSSESYITLRGDAVSVVIEIKCENKLYYLVVEETRLATAGCNTSFQRRQQALAGKTDGRINFRDVLRQEMDEELGQFNDLFNKSEINDLGYIFTSQGMLDEKIHMFGIRVHMSLSELIDFVKAIGDEQAYSKFTDKLLDSNVPFMGVENEKIRLRLIDNPVSTHDCKLLAGITMLTKSQ